MSDKRYPRICFMCNCEAKYLGRLDRSQGWEIKMVIENTLSKSTEQKKL